jgi:CubicO group peptidase (beta-lactamase class C family)
METKHKAVLVLSTAALLAAVVPAWGKPYKEPQSLPPEAAANSNTLARSIDELVIGEMQTANVPGYALAVIKDGNLIVHRGYGSANLSTHQGVTPKTVFGLASLTKTFTALVLLSLVDENKLHLEDTLDQYIDNLPPSYRKLTLRQLASMTAGVPSRVTREVAWKNQLPILTAMPLVSQPGTAFLYSNFSYRLLGSVIEKVTHKPYLDVVQERVFGPLNMTSSGTTVSLATSGLLAQGYGDNMGNAPVRPVEYKDPEVSFSAGMLASTVDDLINYVRGLMARRILSPKGFQTYWYERPALAGGEPSRWAFGWASTTVPKVGGTLKVGMNGATAGVASTIIMLPEKNCAVIALSNLRKPAVHAIAKKVAALAFALDSNEAENQPARADDSGGE